MEKVLVVSYRFPPADETGTKRTWALAKYLKEMGYYPVFVTRNWDYPLKNVEDILVPTGKNIKHETRDDYEVYYLPHKDILKNKLNRRYRNRFTLIRKVYNLLDIILMYFGKFHLNEFKAFQNLSEKIIVNDRSIKKAIVITDPYPLFYLGYILNKKYGIRWIADYRDDWNTREVIDTYGFKPNLLHRIVNKLSILSEKKWVSTARFITSVSDAYTNRVAKFVNVEGVTIYNGYFEEDYINYNQVVNTDSNNNIFTIIHSGTLYPLQPIEIFLEGFKKAVDYYENDLKIVVKFIGITYKPGSLNRIKEYMKNYEENYVCCDRIPQQELFQEIANADCTLLISFGKQFKGLTTSKIFDYLALKKPIICCPTDGDVVEQILTESNLGILCDTPIDVFNAITSHINRRTYGNTSHVEINQEAISQFSRRRQTKKVAELLNQL